MNIVDKTMIQAMKERITDIARKCATIKPFPFMEDDETDESEEN